MLPFWISLILFIYLFIYFSLFFLFSFFLIRSLRYPCLRVLYYSHLRLGEIPPAKELVELRAGSGSGLVFGFLNWFGIGF